MIKHIFCDLDGTLYHNGINDEDAKAIKEIELKGVRFNIATGRIFTQADKMTKDKLTINGYYICENGAYIHDKDHSIIFKGTMSILYFSINSLGTSHKLSQINFIFIVYPPQKYIFHKIILYFLIIYLYS